MGVNISVGDSAYQGETGQAAGIDERLYHATSGFQELDIDVLNSMPGLVQSEEEKDAVRRVLSAIEQQIADPKHFTIELVTYMHSAREGYNAFLEPLCAGEDWNSRDLEDFMRNSDYEESMEVAESRGVLRRVRLYARQAGINPDTFEAFFSVLDRAMVRDAVVCVPPLPEPEEALTEGTEIRKLRKLG